MLLVVFGKKYEVVMNWGFKVVICEWLEMCIKFGKFVDEFEFKLKFGESNAEFVVGEIYVEI